MKRKAFLKGAALTAAGSIVMPYLLPSGRLFAATGSRRANHVVFCLFAGGVRNLESMQKSEGNAMPFTLNGTESISPDIIGGMSPLPSPTGARLQTLGTLYKEFRYLDGPTGHYNGHTTAITGRYSDEAIKLKEPPKYPTIFEYYRKHNSPSMSALNAWWISDQLGPYPYLNYSDYPGYGPMYGANQVSPLTLFSPESFSAVGNPMLLTEAEKSKCDLMKEFMNGQFKTSTQLVQNGIKNTAEDAEHLQTFLRNLMFEVTQGLHTNPWGASMNSDMYNLYFATKVMQEFKPELMVVNMQAIDIGHFEFTSYVDNIRRADYALYKLWESIQNTPGMANDTILIAVPEHGRNATSNSVVDAFGRYALDHTNDEMSRRLFCLIVGPPGKVKQNQVFSNPKGESIDVVPTIADILGFYDDVYAQGILPGSPLTEAFV